MTESITRAWARHQRGPLFAAGALLGWLGLPLLLGQVHFARDVMFFKAPYLAELSRALAEGRFPAWSTRLGGGMPLWHHPAAELADPLLWMVAPLPTLLGWSVAVVLHAVAAAVGMARLARALRVEPWVAGATGVAYAGCGAVASLWTVKLVPATGLPWLILACLGLARGGTWIAVALAAAFLLLHPDPPMLLGAALAAGAVVAGRVRREGSGSGRRFARGIGAGVVVGALLAGPFLLPASAVPADADRMARSGSPDDGADLGPGVLLETFAPGALGLRGHAGAAGVQVDWATPVLAPHAALGSAAWMALVLAVFRAFRGGWRRLDAWMGGVGGALLVAGSGAVPGTHLALEALGGRFPQKLWVPGSLLLLLVAGRALTSVLHGPRRLPPVPAWIVPALLVGAGGVVTASVSPAGGDPEQVRGMVMESVGLAALFGWMAAVVAWRVPAHVAAPALAAAWSLQMLLCLSGLNITTSADRLEQATAQHLGTPFHGQVVAVLNPAHAIYPVPSVRDPDEPGDVAIRVAVAMGMPHSPVVGRAREVAAVDYSQLHPAPMAAFMTGVLPHLDAAGVSAWSRAFGAERVVTPLAPTERTPAGLERVAVLDLGVAGRWMDAHVAQPRPLVELVTRWSVSTDARAIHRAIGGDPTAVVLDEGDTSGGAGDAPPGTLEVLRRTDEHVDARVRAQVPSVVLLRHTRAAGWTAQVDGADVNLRTANLAQMAVPVPPGEHTVTFRYRAPRAGVGVGAGVLGLALLAVGWRRRARDARA